MIGKIEMRDVSLAFERFDESNTGKLDFYQMQCLLMSYGVRPTEQHLTDFMSSHEHVDLARTTEIVNSVIPVDVARRKLLRAFAFEDAQEERPIDGLVRADHLVEVLQGWRLADAQIVDALRGFTTSDGRLDYVRFVEYMFPVEQSFCCVGVIGNFQDHGALAGVAGLAECADRPVVRGGEDEAGDAGVSEDAAEAEGADSAQLPAEERGAQKFARPEKADSGGEDGGRVGASSPRSAATA